MDLKRLKPDLADVAAGSGLFLIAYGVFALLGAPAVALLAGAVLLVAAVRGSGSGGRQ